MILKIRQIEATYMIFYAYEHTRKLILKLDYTISLACSNVSRNSVATEVTFAHPDLLQGVLQAMGGEVVL